MSLYLLKHFSREVSNKPEFVLQIESKSYKMLQLLVLNWLNSSVKPTYYKKAVYISFLRPASAKGIIVLALSVCVSVCLVLTVERTDA